MKRVLFLVLGIAAISPHSYAQSDTELIEQALAAAPRRARDGASVIKWSADHTYTTIKTGTNKVVCYSRADQRGRQPFAMQCTSMATSKELHRTGSFVRIAPTTMENGH